LAVDLDAAHLSPDGALNGRPAPSGGDEEGRIMRRGG
jgi:hypothetical protein